MRTTLRWACRGAITGAALFGATVAVLGGATMSLLLFYWGAGVLVECALARVALRKLRGATEVLS